MTVEETAFTHFQKIWQQQTEKGIAKYGHLIQLEDPGYDWYDMAMAELVDAIRYLTALKMRSEQVRLSGETPNRRPGGWDTFWGERGE